MGNQTFHYRYPSKLTALEAKADDDSLRMLIGVTSYGPAVERRDAIRATWGQDADGVVFLVAGEWDTAIDQEFQEHNDLLWVDRPEEYYWGLTPKTMSFWHAAVKTSPSFEYFVKTDDDVYVNVTYIKQVLENDRPSYWGSCKEGTKPFREKNHRWNVPKDLFPRDEYPAYAPGLGVILSADAATCAVNQIEDVFPSTYMPMEDVATGLLMEACEQTCTFHDGLYDDYEIGRLRTGKATTILHHGVMASDMTYVHQRKRLPHEMVNCGKAPSINAEWNHFAYTCAKCVPADWGTTDMCSGHCQWSTAHDGKKECVPVDPKKKGVCGRNKYCKLARSTLHGGEEH